MAILPFKTSLYANQIYRLGTNSLSAIPTAYYIPVEQYAAANFGLDEIQYALAQGWITQTEYDETVAYI
jgi:hypothetical protein